MDDVGISSACRRLSPAGLSLRGRCHIDIPLSQHSSFIIQHILSLCTIIEIEMLNLPTNLQTSNFSLINLLTPSLTQTFTYLFTHSLIQPRSSLPSLTILYLIYKLTHPNTHSLMHSLTHTLTDLLTNSIYSRYSLTDSLPHPPTYLLFNTKSLPLILTSSLTYSPTKPWTHLVHH